MASQGPLSPGTGASVDNPDQPGDLAWTSPGNVAASDNAQASINGGLGDSSRYLQATNFGFSIPAGATIDGIVVEVERRSQFANSVTDQRSRIVKGGTIQSTDKAAAGFWPTTDAYQSYGANNDLWGATWTAADINNSGFGFALTCEDTGGVALRPAVDHIRITVYYTAVTFKPKTTFIT